MGISAARIADAIEAFIRKEHQVPPDDPDFTRDAHLFESGFVDSVGFTQLLAFIESTFGVAVDEQYLFSDDFTNVTGISMAVHSCLGQRESRDAGRAF